MTDNYRSTIDITGADDITTARSLVLNGVQELAQQDGIILSQDDVVDRTALSRYEREGRTYLQAVLATGAYDESARPPKWTGNFHSDLVLSATPVTWGAWVKPVRFPW
jgi:hypothetical protein